MTTESAASPLPPREAEATRRRLSVGEYVGFLPALALYGAFFAVPLGLIVAYSFWKVIDYNVVHEWTTENYRYFFSVPTYVRTMWATVWVSVLSTVLTIADTQTDRKSTRLNSSHVETSYAVFCLKKKNNQRRQDQRPRGQSDGIAPHANRRQPPRHAGGDNRRKYHGARDDVRL